MTGIAMVQLPTLEARVRPEHTAVVVIDMQNDFCAVDGFIEKVLGRDAAACRAVSAPIATLTNAARSHGVPVFWVRAIYDPHRLPAGILQKRRERTDAACCETGSWGAEFYGPTPAPSDSIVDKHSFSALIGTNLDVQLRRVGARTLVFAGVQTNVCVECSVRDAVCMGYHAVVAADCVASHDKALHEATLKNVGMLFGDAVDSDAVMAVWSSAASGYVGEKPR